MTKHMQAVIGGVIVGVIMSGWNYVFNSPAQSANALTSEITARTTADAELRLVITQIGAKIDSNDDKLTAIINGLGIKYQLPITKK